MPRKRRAAIWRQLEGPATVESIRQAMARHLQSSLAKDEYSSTTLDHYYALCFSVRDRLVDRWVNTQQTYYQKDARRVYYLSMEYLMGRALHNALVNLDMVEVCRAALKEEGIELADLERLEPDAGLGNGGLGRLAACFIDSMATMGLPAYGYGLRYDYGIFAQRLEDGRQVEEADDWLRLPYPWEYPRPEYLLPVGFGGEVERGGDGGATWRPAEAVLAMPYDTPIPGYGVNTVNTLRLWRAVPSEAFDFSDFNRGDYVGAVEDRVMSENLTRVLYPNDNIHLGKVLRLKQQYLLVAATLQDAIRRHLVNHKSLDNLHEKAVFQLNDTHPALAVPELMRVLVDERGYTWDDAWEITGKSLAYTNHTLLPEALERWRVDLLGELLPRHLQIVGEINHRFLERVRAGFPGDGGLVRRVSIFDEGPPKQVRMANLAVVGSFSVNGVAELHTELLRTRVLKDFHQIWPDKLNNKTNGVTQRRWLRCCNPDLAGLITDTIGDGWITYLEQLRELEPMADNAAFLDTMAWAKRAAKARLADHLRAWHGIDLNPDFLFDIQIKRIHEYKRQLLNLLHIVHLYRSLQRDPQAIATPRAFIFGGKAAPGYHVAKAVIKLTCDVAARVNAHPEVSQKLRVHFVPNYNVSLAERLFPAADISEQISTAGFEASGTGNMKFAMNGALTLGTMDGANVEIAREVGQDNIFIFGLDVNQVADLRRGGYRPRDHYEQDADLRGALDLIAGGHFSPEEPDRHMPLVQDLLENDHYLHLADFASYRDAHQRVDDAYQDQGRWRRMALANIANTGQFSSDRTIRDYVRDIWKVERYDIDLD